MIIHESEILPVAESTGFKPNIIEKVMHLLNMMNMLYSHPALKGKFALKGGTALNLFIFRIPRLSVDIDLNYIGSQNREFMMEERSFIDKAVLAVAAREGLIVKRMPDSHAGGKWRLNYQSYTEQSGNIEIDMNYMFRQPFWEPIDMDSHVIGTYQAKNIPILDIHELAAGKLAALFSRRQARDLFDVYHLFLHGKLGKKRLRIAFVVYGACNRKDWRKISINDVAFNKKDIEHTLFPLMQDNIFTSKTEKSQFIDRLINECKKRLSLLLPYTKSETEFLNRLLEKGEIHANLITSDQDLQNRIARHPMLLWKIENIRRHLGLTQS